MLLDAKAVLLSTAASRLRSARESVFCPGLDEALSTDPGLALYYLKNRLANARHHLDAVEDAIRVAEGK